MVLYAAGLIVLVLIILFAVAKFTLKVCLSILVLTVVGLTLWWGMSTPEMHKKFEFALTEKIIKINPDGSTSVINKTTVNKVKKND